MPRRKPIITGTIRPVQTSGLGRGRGQDPRPVRQIVGGDILIATVNRSVEIVAMLRAPVAPPMPRPRIETVQRPATASLTNWQGREPYQMVLPIRFDRHKAGATIEPDVRALARLALRDANDTEPPVVVVEGPVPAPANVRNPRWRIEAFSDPVEPPLFNQAGECVRIALDVTLTEYVVDTLLTESLDRRGGRGLTSRATRVRAGEGTLYDVARRAYGGDGSRAADIARANNLRLGVRLKPGQRLRLP